MFIYVMKTINSFSIEKKPNNIVFSSQTFGKEHDIQ